MPGSISISGIGKSSDSYTTADSVAASIAPAANGFRTRSPSSGSERDVRSAISSADHSSMESGT